MSRNISYNLSDTLNSLNCTLNWVDWSDRLRANFAVMRAQITHHREEMIAGGVPAVRIDSFARSLETRLAWTGRHVMRWAAWVCRA